MKRFLAIALVLTLVFALSACGSPNNPSGSSGGNSSAGSAGDSSGGAAAAMVPGKLNFINLDDRDPSVLRGVRIAGNHVGTAEFNAKDPAVEGIRCIFELNEWVEFYPDTDKEYALRVWVLKHRDDQEYYNNCEFSDLMPNFASYCDLHYPADAENPDEWYWGSFYLNPDDAKAGDYDFVFTYEGKAIATLLTRFYNDGELTDKSDAELEQLMKG